MAIERAQGGSGLVEVLDRVLDKGIVIDAWVRLSLVGIELVTVEARVVIASVDTYLRYADALAGSQAVAKPKALAAPDRYDELAAELSQFRQELQAPGMRRRLEAEGQPLLRSKASSRSRKVSAAAVPA